MVRHADGAKRHALPMVRLVSYLIVLRFIVAHEDDVAEHNTLDQTCSLDTISPFSGPSHGGTLVNLTGVGLGDGSAWRCSFGDVLVGAERQSRLGTSDVLGGAELPSRFTLPRLGGDWRLEIGDPRLPCVVP